MTISANTLRLLAYAMLKGVGPVTQRYIASQYDIGEATPEYIATEVKPVARALLGKGAWQVALDRAEQQVELANHFQTRILSLHDAEYPELLRNAKKSPALIYLKGRLAKDPTDSVAIIGSRQPTRHSKIIAERITSFCTSHGLSIVSGLAVGCDGIAHRTALETGAHTVAVLAHGLQTIAPESQRDLAATIIDSGGALISEYSFGTEPSPPLFVQRDKTQAALVNAVVMVQAGLDGGSLHASRAALAQGRWIAVPCPTPHDRRTAPDLVAANKLITSGPSSEIAKLMQCDTAALQRIVSLHGREDYPKLLERIREPALMSNSSLI